MPSHRVERDGFRCEFGRFYAAPFGRMAERVEGSVLRAAFLPKLTPAGNKYIRDSYRGNFVQSQLKHYDVPFNESEFTGNGTQLLKKVLQAGKCDQVPPRISKLRDEMHSEWLAQMTPEELAEHPDWAMEKYFLTSGRPDRAKTTKAIGFPLDRDSLYRSDQLREAAANISGLHHATGYGPKTQTIFIGWHSAAVTREAEKHARDETKAAKAADKAREAERLESHKDYLKTIQKQKGSNTHSPVGTYIVGCKTIEEGWADNVDDLALHIRATPEAGIYKASFDFGILEGVMIMGTGKATLARYCARLNSKNEDDDDDGDDGSEYDSSGEDERKSGNKGKRTPAATKSRGRGRPPKKAKPSVSQSKKYYLKLRCREMGEGMIYPEPEDGAITFQGNNMASFTGKSSFPCVGTAVRFTARKTSDTVYGDGNSWSDYSDAAYEAARVGRWR